MILKLITQVIRILVGGLFIFSGFVKLVDPLGSSYKFEEYFGADVLNMEFLIPYALPFAILLIITELLLGIALLIGFKTKFTLWSLFAITALFLFLTWYSATYDKVTDCGCFGDAVTLTPWETFYKNVVFIIFILVLLAFQKYIKPIFPKAINFGFIIIGLVACLYTTNYVLNYLPVIDFRAFAIGKNIPEGMKYKDDGEIPKIHDFYLESDTEDLTETILTSEKALLVITHNLDKTDTEAWSNVNEQIQEAKAKGYIVYGLSSSGSQTVKDQIQNHQLDFEILFCDDTTLKTMIRANPGLMTLKNGTVVDKQSWRKVDQINW